jgi:N-acyl homoserine lactone hydrolase
MQNVTKKLTIDGEILVIHGISTGLVSVKKSFRESSKKGILSILSFLFDKEFTEWLPIWVWVVEHPEGVFLIDTGASSNVTNKDYFKSSGWFANWFNTSQFKFKVTRDDEIDVQLSKIGIKKETVEKVLLTHLHLDHTDGLKHFPETKIYVNLRELKKPYGNLPKLYPDRFKPLGIELNSVFENFDNTKLITQDGSLIAIQTEGHTHGHTAYLLRTDEGYVLFAGDLIYYQDQLLLDKYAGGHVNVKKAKKSYSNIKGFAKKHKLVILPSHDIDSAERLNEMKPIYENTSFANKP